VQWFNETAGQSESQKRAVIAQIVAATGKPQFRNEVLARKMTFANGLERFMANGISWQPRKSKKKLLTRSLPPQKI
jgi:hypothetical protein